MNRASKRDAGEASEIDVTRARVLGRGLRAGKAGPRLPLRAVREAMRLRRTDSRRLPARSGRRRALSCQTVEPFLGLPPT
jgi:hypothetical protein